VMGVTIEGLQAIAPTNVGVRIYDSSSQSLIASSNLVLQPTTIPMTVTFPFDTLLQPFELVHLVLYAEDPMSVRLTRARAFSFPGSSVHEVVNAYRTIGQGDVIPQTPTDEIFEASLTLFDPSVTAVQDLPASGLRKVALRAAPNPFNPRTMVSFDLPTAGQIDIDMHDVRGRRVCSIASGFWPAGRHQMPFDGRDSRGRPLASGVYFLRLRAASSTVVKKVGLVK